MAKRSITISGHRTSVSVEQPFWRALSEIAAARGLSIAALTEEIDGGREPSVTLSSAIRLYVLDWYRVRSGSRLVR